MITISLCMIVKNEEEVLADCLSSVQDIVDEMIIVDTGSTDQTKEIAHSFQQRYWILNGCSILQKHVTLLSHMQRKSIFYGSMLTMFCLKKTAKTASTQADT